VIGYGIQEALGDRRGSFSVDFGQNTFTVIDREIAFQYFLKFAMARKAI
jgi:hypothetical protein